jgi:hypothetical protein
MGENRGSWDAITSSARANPARRMVRTSAPPLLHRITQLKPAGSQAIAVVATFGQLADASEQIAPGLDLTSNKTSAHTTISVLVTK